MIRPPNAISGILVAPTHPPKAKNRKRHKKKNKNKKNATWADKCMYAELLEMSEDDTDDLPENLESDWVAVGPVPAGKRCLAVTHQSSGIAGVGDVMIFHLHRNRLFLMLVYNSEYDFTLKVAGKNPHPTFSIESTAIDNFGLYTRCKLAR